MPSQSSRVGRASTEESPWCHESERPKEGSSSSSSSAEHHWRMRVLALSKIDCSRHTGSKCLNPLSPVESERAHSQPSPEGG